MLISGTVVAGNRRGREPGFPTANIEIEPDVGSHLQHDVSSGRASGRPAAISVGVRPTFGQGRQPLVEGIG
jgi:FAD synthase